MYSMHQTEDEKVNRRGTISLTIIRARLPAPPRCAIIAIESQLMALFGADMAIMHSAIAYAPDGFGSESRIRLYRKSISYS